MTYFLIIWMLLYLYYFLKISLNLSFKRCSAVLDDRVNCADVCPVFNSGWDSALVQADITTGERADGILKAAHITRSRYAHQVSACALYILQRKAYKEYTASRDSSDIDFETWIQDKSEHHPQFQFWARVLCLSDPSDRETFSYMLKLLAS